MAEPATLLIPRTTLEQAPYQAQAAAMIVGTSAASSSSRCASQLTSSSHCRSHASPTRAITTLVAVKTSRRWGRPTAARTIACVLGCCSPQLAAGALCQVERLAELEGVIDAVGGAPQDPTKPHSGCAWLISPGIWLEAIELVTRSSQFVGGDRLSLYASSVPDGNSLVGRFSASQPLPEQMVMTGSSEALLVLTANSNITRFEMEFACRPSGHRIGGHYFSPVTYISVMATLVLLGALFCMTPVYLICYCRAKWRQEQALQSSQVVLHAELSQRRQNAIEHFARTALAEQRVSGALEALPVQTWHVGEVGELEDCCLCLDRFQEADILRVLPCEHYFHRTCIDKWFNARRYLPRSCPLCKRDPVAYCSAVAPEEGASGVHSSDLGQAESRTEEVMPTAVRAVWSDAASSSSSSATASLRESASANEALPGTIGDAEADAASISSPLSPSADHFPTAVSYGRGLLGPTEDGPPRGQADPVYEISGLDQPVALPHAVPSSPRCA